jgi:hypothetical protein
MTRTLSLGLLVTLLSSAAASAQAPDPRWNAWLGCWSLVADANVAALPPAEQADGGLTGPIRPGSSRDARVCVAPRLGGAELETMVGDQRVLTQTIVADGVDHPVDEGGCVGTQRAQWSSDGFRLFTRAQVRCGSQPERQVTGIALIAPNGDWVDVQAVAIDGRDSVRVRRFGPPAERRQTGAPASAVRLQIDDVTEATRFVSPRAIEAALMETSSRFPLSSKALIDLDKAGVDDRVIDLMVALSYPRSFAVRPSGPDDRLTPFPPLVAGADYVDASYDNPFFYGPYYSNYYYSPYFFSPFGYSYLRYYPGFYAPVAVVVPGAGGGGGGGEARPPQTGRVVNGRGYTRVERRGDATAVDTGGGGDASRSGGSSRGTVSRRGYSGGDAGGSSSSSGGGGGSTGGGGASSGGSSGSTGGGGRTAVPR